VVVPLAEAQVELPGIPRGRNLPVFGRAHGLEAVVGKERVLGILRGVVQPVTGIAGALGVILEEL
jgi:hypothetical protein